MRKVLILSFIYKGSFYFRVLLGKQWLGWWRKYDQEMRLQHQVVSLFIINADFFLSLSVIYLFRELETGKQPWRFSSYLNRTVLGLCTQSAVIGNHSYHAPIFQKQYNPILWPMNQGSLLYRRERLGPGRTGRKTSLRHSFCRRKLTKENLVSWILNCTLE